MNSTINNFNDSGLLARVATEELNAVCGGWSLTVRWSFWNTQCGCGVVFGDEGILVKQEGRERVFTPFKPE